jgi:hypothetical protein
VASNHCPREAETIRAAWGGRAETFDADLAAHLAECEGCAEVAALARALHNDRDDACASAHPPSAGVVWWRAQRRVREEAARRAARPISFVHGIALGCAAAAAVAIVSLGAGGLQRYLAAFGGLSWWTSTGAPAVTPADAFASLPYGAMLVLAATLLLAPVAIYLALSEK